MRRVVKSADSEIVNRQLTYKKDNNDELRELLAIEQHYLCAYTETYLAASDDAHIEHFNPNLKPTTADGYHNWFLVKGLWNTRKSTKWADYQPILHPTAEDFEERILYRNGNYILADSEDVKADNLIQLLDLDNAELATQRKRYIERKRKEINNLGLTAQAYFDDLIVDYPEGVYFIRALQEEFQVRVNFDLMKTT
jgi:uncharacterized protein (TIGR02646 family)